MSEFYHQYDTLLIDNPVFGDIASQQHKLQATQFDSPREAFDEGAEVAHCLTTAIAEQGLSQKEVRLSGPQIYTPHATLDPDQGTPVFSSRIVSINNECPTDPPIISGHYRGVCPLVMQEPDNSYRVDLHHQLTFTTTDDSYGTIVGKVAFHGSVSGSHLEFVDDIHSIQFVDALNTLADASHDTDTATTTALLHDLLTPENKNDIFDPYRLRKIGKAVRLLEDTKSEIDMKYRDGVIDLVGAKLAYIAQPNLP